jgi:hypothetical protein
MYSISRSAFSPSNALGRFAVCSSAFRRKFALRVFPLPPSPLFINPSNTLSDPEHANQKLSWRFSILLSKNPYPSRPFSPASRKNPTNKLSDLEHPHPKNVEKSKSAGQKTPPPAPPRLEDIQKLPSP